MTVRDFKDLPKRKFYQKHEFKGVPINGKNKYFKHARNVFETYGTVQRSQNQPPPKAPKTK